MKPDNSPAPIDAQVRIGHVHLKVADLELALRFYCGVLGFELTQQYGTQAAFVSAGGYHHHIGLNTWESLGGAPPPPVATGLYHVAILYPNRRALADALQRVSRLAFHWMGPAIMASARRFICATLMKTAWNCIGIGHRMPGRGRRKARWRCSRGDSIWTAS